MEFTKIDEVVQRFCEKMGSCWECPFNREEYSYNEYDEEGNYYDVCELEGVGKKDALKLFIDLYEKYKNDPVVDLRIVEDYRD